MDGAEDASRSSSQNHLPLSSPLGIVQRDSFMALVPRNGFKSTKRQRHHLLRSIANYDARPTSSDLCIEGANLGFAIQALMKIKNFLALFRK